MTPGADIKHDARLPWGHWMRTIRSPHHGVVIIDEHDREWRSLREAFWNGRLNMSGENPTIVDENCELLLAVLASKAGASVPFGEDVAGLYGGNAAFYRFHTYWAQAVGLLEPVRSPFGVGTTPEGASVVKMLLITRPPELAAVPISAEALRALGPPGSPTECDRAAYEVPNGPSGAYPYVIVREDRWHRRIIAMLHRDPEEMIPMARTIWTVTCTDDATRDRLHRWLYDRMHRWTAWGEIVSNSGPQALTQHLLALIASDPAFGPRTDGYGAPPFVTN